MSFDSPATAIGHLKFWYKAFENHSKFCRADLQKAKISGPAGDRLDDFSKSALILSSHMLYQSSLEHNTLFFKQCTDAVKD